MNFYDLMINHPPESFPVGVHVHLHDSTHTHTHQSVDGLRTRDYVCVNIVC